ncbi:MAG: histidine--tRNA ligase, partial [Calditrichae bacterium]|nr:histidine--tRNA ligase [Calditrichia bacterium]
MAKKIQARIYKGTRDFLPEQMIKRNYVINIIKNIFEKYGFEPLETPTLELWETLSGKYGEEADRLTYRFIDRGDREVGLRYDLTVPLSRVMAMYPNLPKPFRRYQIQPVWRADKPQKGRFREF